MSYCVNCGVELAASEKKCPLCGTVVINPNAIFDDSAATPYPRDEEQLHLDLRENRRLTAVIISVLIAFPAVVCMVCDFGITRSLSWSNFVIVSCALLWCFIFPPIMMKKANVLYFVAIDTLAVLLFLMTVSKLIRLQGKAADWYSEIALPIVLCAGVFVSFAIVIIRSRHYKPLKKMAYLLFITAAMVIAVEIVTDLYLGKLIELNWSLITLAPCALIAILLLVVDRKRGLKDSIAKRTFID